MYDIDGNGTIDEREMIKIIEVWGLWGILQILGARVHGNNLQAIYEMLGPEVTKSAGNHRQSHGHTILALISTY